MLLSKGTEGGDNAELEQTYVLVIESDIDAPHNRLSGEYINPTKLPLAKVTPTHRRLFNALGKISNERSSQMDDKHRWFHADEHRDFATSSICKQSDYYSQ